MCWCLNYASCTWKFYVSCHDVVIIMRWWRHHRLMMTHVSYSHIITCEIFQYLDKFFNVMMIDSMSSYIKVSKIFEILTFLKKCRGGYPPCEIRTSHGRSFSSVYSDQIAIKFRILLRGTHFIRYSMGQAIFWDPYWNRKIDRKSALFRKSVSWC